MRRARYFLRSLCVCAPGSLRSSRRTGEERRDTATAMGRAMSRAGRRRGRQYSARSAPALLRSAPRCCVCGQHRRALPSGCGPFRPFQPLGRGAAPRRQTALSGPGNQPTAPGRPAPQAPRAARVPRIGPSCAAGYDVPTRRRGPRTLPQLPLAPQCVDGFKASVCESGCLHRRPTGSDSPCRAVEVNTRNCSTDFKGRDTSKG